MSFRPFLRTLGLVLLTIGPMVARDEFERASLRGISGVVVLVEPVEPEIATRGIDQTRLRTQIELRLRQLGVRVLTKPERIGGILHLSVNVMCRGESGTR